MFLLHVSCTSHGGAKATVCEETYNDIKSGRNPSPTIEVTFRNGDTDDVPFNTIILHDHSRQNLPDKIVDQALISLLRNLVRNEINRHFEIVLSADKHS